MSARHFTVRCYKYHDPDILSFFRTYDVSMQWLARESLRAFVRREPMLFLPGEKRREPPPDAGWAYKFHFSLDSKKDADVLEFLDGVKPGMRCVFIKNIIRYSLYCPVTERMLRDPDGLPGMEAVFAAHRTSPRAVTAAGYKSRASCGHAEESGADERETRPESGQVREAERRNETTVRAEPDSAGNAATGAEKSANGIDMELLMGFSDML